MLEPATLTSVPAGSRPFYHSAASPRSADCYRSSQEILELVTLSMGLCRVLSVILKNNFPKKKKPFLNPFPKNKKTLRLISLRASHLLHVTVQIPACIDVLQPDLIAVLHKHSVVALVPVQGVAVKGLHLRQTSITLFTKLSIIKKSFVTNFKTNNFTHSRNNFIRKWA